MKNAFPFRVLPLFVALLLVPTSSAFAEEEEITRLSRQEFTKKLFGSDSPTAVKLLKTVKTMDSTSPALPQTMEKMLWALAEQYPRSKNIADSYYLGKESGERRLKVFEVLRNYFKSNPNPLTEVSQQALMLDGNEKMRRLGAKILGELIPPSELSKEEFYRENQSVVDLLTLKFFHDAHHSVRKESALSLARLSAKLPDLLPLNEALALFKMGARDSTGALGVLSQSAPEALEMLKSILEDPQGCHALDTQLAALTQLMENGIKDPSLLPTLKKLHALTKEPALKAKLKQSLDTLAPDSPSLSSCMAKIVEKFQSVFFHRVLH